MKRSVKNSAAPGSTAAKRTMLGGGLSRGATSSSKLSSISNESRVIEQLKRRRVEDLERLAQVTKARDLLEARTAEILEQVAKLREKLSERDKQLEQLDRRVGGARLLGQADLNPTKPDSTGWKGLAPFIASRWWQMATIRAARRAHRQGRLAEAQVLFDAALLGGEAPDLWVELGHVLREREVFEPAEWAYRRSLELKPGNGEVLFLRGFCLERCGKNEQAARLYEAALEADPGLASRYEHLRDFPSRLFD